MKKYLVTAALPYGNGPLHFGHLAGVYIPADIYTRHKKLQGNECIYISGSDEHGVAITMNAKKAGVDYQEYVNSWHENHKSIFSKYGVKFDFFGQTSADYHKEETLKWFNKLHSLGYIQKQDEKQFQCTDCKNFLPDRYVEGECYECGYEQARGDECPKCGIWIEALKLKNPVCKFCESKNIEIVDAFQWYLMLSKHQEHYDKWLNSKTDWRKTVLPYLKSLSSDGLINRAITRDLDWGIDVPLEEAKDKKLYVWFDAPIGYVSNTKKLFEGTDTDYINDWWNNEKTVLTQFIGKDNIIFHGLIFPIMSEASGFAKTVDALPANQYVNLMGKQFSKSQGWYVDADKAVDQFGEDAMRFYLASLIPEMQDSSFTWEGFEVKINNELANNIGNFINRCLKFYVKNYPEGLSANDLPAYEDSSLYTELKKHALSYHEYLDNHQFKKAIESLMAMGFSANTYFSDREPWAKIKVDEEHAKETLYHASITVYVLGVYFSALLPKLSSTIREHFSEEFLDESFIQKVYNHDWDELTNQLKASPFKIMKKPKGLVPKIDKDVLDKLKSELVK